MPRLGQRVRVKVEKVEVEKEVGVRDQDAKSEIETLIRQGWMLGGPIGRPKYQGP